MKLSTILSLNLAQIASGYSERGLIMMIGDRFIYDDPICPDIATCKGYNGKISSL